MPTPIEKIFEDVQLHVNFTQANSRSNIVTYDSTASEPENISTAFGKLSKWYEALVPTGGSSGQILGWNSSGTAKWINNTHSLSITAAASGDTSSISLSPNTKYKLTAGGSDFIFTSPNHVTVTKSADTTSTASPDHGGTFTTVDSVTRDTWGHVTKINTKTITLPSDNDRYVNSASFVDDSTNTAASPVKMTLTRAGSDNVTIVANIPKVSSSSAGVVPKGAAVSTPSQSTKFLREDGSWAVPVYTSIPSGNVTGTGLTADKVILGNGNSTIKTSGKGITDNSSATAVTSTDTNLITARTLYYAGYLPLSGGTMTGTLTAKASQYADEYGGALNMNNSNIYGVNSIYTADVSDSASEGIHFYRDSTHVDTLWMNGGSLLFVPNRELGTNTTVANSQKVARFTVNPTTGQVVITDGTTGGIKSSGYTIATSVPSGAVFTDQNVRQSQTTTTNFRPLLFGATNTTTVADLAATITGDTYASTKFYAQPSSGSLYAANYKTTATAKGYFLVDSSSTEYPGIYDNGSNLWIGSLAGASKHHIGATYISAGHNGTAGYSTIYVAVPNAGNTDSSSYPVLHSGNYTSYTVKKDGTGASGTWEISITGTAANVAWSGVTSKPVIHYGYNTAVGNTTDWNTLTDAGCYKIQMASWGNAATYHSPNAYLSTIYSFGLLFNVKSGVSTENRLAQIYMPHNQWPIVVRWHNSSDGAYTAGWGDWKPIYQGISKSDVGLGNVENKSSATIRGELTSSNVTTALGFTPANSTHTHDYAGSSSAGGAATSADALNLTHGNELNFSKLASTGHVWLGYRWNTHGTETSGGTTITTYKFGNANGAGGLAGLEATTSTFKSGNFGDQLIVERTGGANMAGITFKNTSGVLGYIAANTVDGDLYHYGADTNKKYVILDSYNCSSYTFKVTRGASQSTATSGYWAAMCNSSQTGSPVLPTSGKWWHVISMDWTNDVKNWVSQLAIATQDGSGVWWRRNDTGGTTIDSYSWHRLAEGNSSGAATNVATEVGSSAGARPVFFAYLGDNTRVVYNTNFTYNPSGNVLTAGTISASAGVNSNTANSSTAGGLSLYATNPDQYGVIFRGTSQKGKHGYVTSDWATYFTMNDSATRGWIFNRNASSPANVASISGGGNAVFNGSVTVGGNAANTSGCRLTYNSSTQSLDFVFA